MNGFSSRYITGLDMFNYMGILSTEGNLTNEEIYRLQTIREAWNFYEGFHWEGIDDTESAQVTFNYCQTFVNKYVAFEFGKGFSIKTATSLDKVGVTINDTKIDTEIDDNFDGIIDPDELQNSLDNPKVVEKTLLDFLNDVWIDNKKDLLSVEIGQTKSITGEAWVKVGFDDPEEMDIEEWKELDPFDEYPNGRIRLTVIPTQYVYPTYDQHDKDLIKELLIMYPIDVTERKNTILPWTRNTTRQVLYKEVWNRSEIIVYHGKEEVDRMDNPYGIIPFEQVKNFPVAGRSHGKGDLDDVIPLNVELNSKKSDISEIIDYHAAPITVVYGSKIGNLEKGANKVWGGLPKDAKVSNLELQSDLGASSNYTESLKKSMCEIGNVPESVLGGASAISNTSGVALQYINLPLIERTRVKRLCTADSLARINKMIIFIALKEKLIEKPSNVTMTEFLYTEVTLPDTLPKDELMELNKIQLEMNLGLEDRNGAMERLGKQDIVNRLAQIDIDRSKFPEVYGLTKTVSGPEGLKSSVNSGMLNGQTPIEQVRTELTGQNGGSGV